MVIRTNVDQWTFLALWQTLWPTPITQSVYWELVQCQRTANVSSQSQPCHRYHKMAAVWLLHCDPTLPHDTYEDWCRSFIWQGETSVTGESSITGVVWQQAVNSATNTWNLSYLFISCFSLLRLHFIFLQIPRLYLCLDQWITGLNTAQHQTCICALISGSPA